MAEIPQAWVEKATLALVAARKPGPFCRGCADVDDGRCDTTGEPCDPIQRDAEAVLLAVWDDLPAARPVVDRDALIEALLSDTMCARRRTAELVADGLLRSGVVQDAADVRRAVAEAIAAALVAHDPVEWALAGQWSGEQAARIARDVAASPAHPATPATTHPQPEEGRDG